MYGLKLERRLFVKISYEVDISDIPISWLVSGELKGSFEIPSQNSRYTKKTKNPMA
jgi:hypothetical protein